MRLPGNRLNRMNPARGIQHWNRHSTLLERESSAVVLEAAARRRAWDCIAPRSGPQMADLADETGSRAARDLRSPALSNCAGSQTSSGKSSSSASDCRPVQTGQTSRMAFTDATSFGSGVIPWIASAISRI